MEKNNRYHPYASDSVLGKCSCGQHASQHEHEQALNATHDTEQHSHEFVEAALMKAIFPQGSAGFPKK